MENIIKQKALDLGFSLVGIASANPHPHTSFFNDWLAKGYDAGMAYLKRGQEKRGNPDLILPGVKSLVVCGLHYHTDNPLSIECQDNAPLGRHRALDARSESRSRLVGCDDVEEKGWVARYAWGDDYHEVMGEMLQKLETEILRLYPEAKTKSYVDTGAILERSYGESAGLGWIGKNTCLINTKKGSFFFIGEILTTLDLQSDVPDIDHCGKCTRCIDACPTQALTPYELDSNKCISYITIEHRGEIPSAMKGKIVNHLVGCDICQDVCPWNTKAPTTDNIHFQPREGFFNPSLNDWNKMTPDEFKIKFKESPIKRLKFEGLKRNVETSLTKKALSN